MFFKKMCPTLLSTDGCSSDSTAWAHATATTTQKQQEQQKKQQQQRQQQQQQHQHLAGCEKRSQGGSESTQEPGIKAPHWQQIKQSVTG